MVVISLGPHVDAGMSEELGAVDHDPGAVRVGETRDAVDVRKVPGHVRGPGHGHELDLVLGELSL